MTDVPSTVPSCPAQPFKAPTKMTMKPLGIPVGQYKVQFIGLEPAKSSQYGDGLRWKFQVCEGPLTGAFTARQTAVAPTPGNSCGKMLSGVAGKTIVMDESVDLDLFIGQVYRVLVTDPDGRGSRVEAILPA